VRVSNTSLCVLVIARFDAEKMKEAQIINERTAEMLEPLQPISINHKESKSKKAQAFQLFNADKRPSDSEVKSLGIKPETAYRYYQDWKKIKDNSHNPTKICNTIIVQIIVLNHSETIVTNHSDKS